MHKLIILVDPHENEAQFDMLWPDFIVLTAQLPGLRRETTSRVTFQMFGQHSFSMIHELFFDSSEAARQALNSPIGVQAGRTLQRITGGRVTLLLADHLEDDPKRYAPPPTPAVD